MPLGNDPAFQRTKEPKKTQRDGMGKPRVAPTCLLVAAAWPTCPGTQEENEDGLLPEVPDGQVSLLPSHGAIHPLVAVAFAHRKERER